MHPFEQYLQHHKLEAITVSIRAGVRYVTVWNATKGKPITLDHARKIKQAVFFITGMPYTGTLTITDPAPVNELPTIPMKKFPRHNPN